jgi:hypothetical protein
MDIQLKESEIKAAVRNYVAEKIGINLTGKNLGITFSATRGQGMIANLSITDASDTEIPGFTDRAADTEEVKQSADVVKLEAKAGTVGAAIAGAADTPAADEPAIEEVKTVPADDAPAADAAASTSLFNQ